jgi:hypothetical protein
LNYLIAAVLWKAILTGFSPVCIALVTSSFDDFLFFDNYHWGETTEVFRRGMIKAIRNLEVLLGLAFAALPVACAMLAARRRSAIKFTLSLMQFVSQ